MPRSAPFPGVNVKKIKRSPEEIERQKAYFEELDDRGRLYVTAEEIAAMQRGLGRVDLSIGPRGAWLRSYSPSFPAMFNFLIEYRTVAALGKSQY